MPCEPRRSYAELGGVARSRSPEPMRRGPALVDNGGPEHVLNGLRSAVEERFPCAPALSAHKHVPLAGHTSVAATDDHPTSAEPATLFASKRHALLPLPATRQENGQVSRYARAVVWRLPPPTTIVRGNFRSAGSWGSSSTFWLFPTKPVSCDATRAVPRDGARTDEVRSERWLSTGPVASSGGEVSDTLTPLFGPPVEGHRAGVSGRYGHFRKKT